MTVQRLLCVMLFALYMGPLSSPARAADYSIDTAHSSIGFKVKHLGISSVPGKLVEFEGSFSYDEKNPTSAKADASIKAASIDTDNKKRDDHLRNPDFLDATKFPLITFKSKKIDAVNGDKFKVIGDLTIRDVTKEVTLDAEFGGAAKDPWGGERAAFTATAEINRKDFGLTWNKALETGGLLVGDQVKIILEIEGVKKAA